MYRYKTLPPKICKMEPDSINVAVVVLKAVSMVRMDVD